MTTRTYGILAVIGSALGAWWWMRQRTLATESASERGTVIFANTPTATDLSQGVI